MRAVRASTVCASCTVKNFTGSALVVDVAWPAAAMPGIAAVSETALAGSAATLWPAANDAAAMPLAAIAALDPFKNKRREIGFRSRRGPSRSSGSLMVASSCGIETRDVAWPGRAERAHGWDDRSPPRRVAAADATRMRAEVPSAQLGIGADHGNSSATRRARHENVRYGPMLRLAKQPVNRQESRQN